MKKIVLLVSLVYSGMISRSQTLQNDLAFVSFHNNTTDSLFESKIYNAKANDADLSTFLASGKAGRTILGYSRQQRPIELYYFPGTSDKKALVVGGVHGSELSALEVAARLIEILQSGERPYYNVLIIPSLFPDNAQLANFVSDKSKNTGRYSDEMSADPNRQMPALGKAFDPVTPYDLYGRLIEKENQMLLQLIQEYQPSRIVNLHAIKDVNRAGIYADPRTDCNGLALGFETDSTLAVSMAKFIADRGGKVPGNSLQTAPTALYYRDPEIAPNGILQKRNLRGSALPNNRGYGVSLGSWATTAVCEGNKTRDAIRLITVEFPGYRSSSSYNIREERDACEWNTQLYAMAVAKLFLHNVCAE